MEEPLDFIPSKASALKKKDTNFQTVVYESYKPKSSKKSSAKPETNPLDEKKEKDFNIKQTKTEVIKLAMSGLGSQQKEEAKINLLIKLGAKPPKRKNTNYKQLQLEKKKAKAEEAKRENLLQLGKNTQGKSTAKGKSFDRKRRKAKGDILSIYGKVKKTANAS